MFGGEEYEVVVFQGWDIAQPGLGYAKPDPSVTPTLSSHPCLAPSCTF